MRDRCFLRLMLPAAVVAVLVAAGVLVAGVLVAGCGKEGGGATTAAPVSTTTGPAAAASTSVGPSTTAGGGPTTGAQGATSEPTGTSAASGPPGAMTPEQVTALAIAAGIPKETVQIFDQETFGDWAAAYVWATEENVYLMVFRWRDGAWVTVDQMTNLDWGEMRSRLETEGAPLNLIEWANPGED